MVHGIAHQGVRTASSRASPRPAGDPHPSPENADGPLPHSIFLPFTAAHAGSGIDDRNLDVYAIQLGRHRDLFGVARYLKSGDFIHGGGVSQYRTSRVRLETEPEMPVNIDGEVVAMTPQDFSVAHNALKVLVPQGSTAARRDLGG